MSLESKISNDQSRSSLKQKHTMNLCLILDMALIIEFQNRLIYKIFLPKYI